ncbi:TonB-dependent receptor [Ramlibacter sp.]|uniref:TonB-dependent receptor family protein n=1 Tax=Ramlibacter sp. TaxID=1917967 RepID=UPI002D294F38|nr:TonB-dependent receptor [Ramlibacter sp.]HYD74687.1 TonB-dependent receptor [Ramlibacter sp.]
MALDRDRRRRRRGRLLAVALSGAAALGAAGEGAAQPADPNQPRRSLAPLTVTVQPGVEQPAFGTPASIDVIDGDVLRNGQLQVNLSEALARVPGVVALDRQNYAQDLQISLRGFGARSTFGVRGIRLYVDGIPATAPDGQGQVSHFDLASAGRLEVLRGPFSALYGNSSGGVISLFTEDGGPDTVAHAATAWGSDGVQRHNLRLSGETGRLQYHLSAMRFRTDGWREHSAARRSTLNGKLGWQLSDDTRLTLVGNGVDMPDVQDPLGLTRTAFEADPRQAVAAATLFDTRKSVRQQQLGLVLDHRIDARNDLKLTAYRGERSTLQFLSIPVAVQVPPTHAGGVVDLDRRYQGLDARWIRRMRWRDRPVTLTAGLAADQVREDRRGFENFVGGTLGVRGALRRDEDNLARNVDAYLQAEWAASERWSLSAGVRHSTVRMRSRDRFVAPGNPDDSGSVRFAAFTPALGAVYHLSESVNLYASAGRGFETPTLAELSYRPGGLPGLNFDLREASSRQWEVGAKARIARDWTLNAALFEARTRNEIVVASNSGGRSVFANAGATRRQGLELAGGGRWDGGWSTQLAATVIDARYRSGPFAGNRLPGVPRTQLFGELAWAHRPWGLQAALEWRRVARLPVDDANSDAAPAASTASLRLSLEQATGRWTFREFIRIDNVTDNAHAGSVIVNEGSGRFFEPAPGRRWLAGASGSYRF